MTQLVDGAVARKSTLLERSMVEACRSHVNLGPDWLLVRRREALDWLEKTGMPTQRDEAFRNAPLATLLGEAMTLRTPQSEAKAVAGFEEVRSSGPVLWLVNGVAMTDAAPVLGVRWLPLAEAWASDARVRKQLGAQARLENGFIAANMAGFSDGWCIIVEPGKDVETPIELRFVESTDARGALSFPRVLVIASGTSHLRLVERHLSPSGQTVLSSAVCEILLEPGAKLEHSRWVDHGNRTWSIASTSVTVESDAEYHCWSATANGCFVRHDLAVRLAGRGATAILDGLYYGRSGQIVDQHTRVWHEQPGGRTRECYRGVIEDEGRGIFDGIIYVGRGAMQTDARQEDRNLLLGPTAIVHTKPHLEIDADDVSCSHGATVGQLDQQQLFYLRSRGIPADEAKAVLTWAFAQEIVDRCPDVGLRHSVERALHRSASSETESGQENVP